MANMSMKICECCKDHRRNADKDPRVLVMLPKSTQNKAFKVLVCEHCDGPVFDLARKFTT